MKPPSAGKRRPSSAIADRERHISTAPRETASSAPPAPKRKKAARPEQALQRQVVDLARLIRPEVLFFHVPNGGRRGKIEAAIFKRLGVLPGVADLAFVLPAGKTGYMELKAAKGGRLSEAQAEFRRRALGEGAAWEEIRTLEQAREVLASWYPRRSIPQL